MIFCCACQKDVEARKTDGREIYPHRSDLFEKRFFVCDYCKNYVGAHRDGRPLGVIPTKEIRAVRMYIHNNLDPLWQSEKISRRDLYKRLSEKLGVKEYHTANIRTVQEAERVKSACLSLEEEINETRCRRCGGSKSNIADDFFIKKCWCTEIELEEQDEEQL